MILSPLFLAGWGALPWNAAEFADAPHRFFVQIRARKFLNFRIR